MWTYSLKLQQSIDYESIIKLITKYFDWLIKKSFEKFFKEKKVESLNSLIPAS